LKRTKGFSLLSLKPANLSRLNLRRCLSFYIHSMKGGLDTFESASLKGEDGRERERAEGKEEEEERGRTSGIERVLERSSEDVEGRDNVNRDEVGRREQRASPNDHPLPPPPFLRRN
jgi:hypothetical protein